MRITRKTILSLVMALTITLGIGGLTTQAKPNNIMTCYVVDPPQD